MSATACAHCGLPVPGDPPPPAFCCPGCRAVHALLHDAGLGAFYELRREMGDAPSGQPVAPVSEGRYAHYDDPAFQERFARDGHAVDLHLDGVHCAACVWVLDRLPRVVPGVESAALDYGRARLRLVWDPSKTTLSHIGEALHRLGYPSRAFGAAAEAARRAARRAELVRLAVTFAMAGNVMLIATAVYADTAGSMEPAFRRFLEWTSMALAVPTVTYGAWPFYRSALAGLRTRVAHMDLPISLGVLAAFGGSAWATITGHGEAYFDSVTVLVFLLLLGRHLQQRGQQAAMNRAEMLCALTPGTAWRRAGDDWEAVPAAAVRPGDVLRLRSGETLPVDGRVASGQGHLDQSLLTGESRPIPVGPGAPVFAGTTSVGGELVVESTASGEETRLGRLLSFIERAETGRAPIVQAADAIVGRFVVTVVGLAIAAGIGWGLYAPERAFDVVVSLLVICCPCALGLATPVALAVARGRAAAAGVLVRDAAALERLARVDQVFFDKTGTLTEGRLTVTHASLDAALRPLVGALEAQSSHPIARALAPWAPPAAPPVEDVVERPGRGIEGTVAGRRVFVGSPAGRDVGPFAPDLARALAAGETPVAVFVDGRAAGLVALGDRVRGDAPEAVERLRGMGLRLGILSGDHPRVAAAVGARLGIAEARGGQTPEDKAAAVSGANAAMVGDGFNDAPALRAAAVGVAVHGGAEVALQVADVYLARPGAAAVADAVEGARRTLCIVRRNLRFSLVYNLGFATLALAGYISPLAAAVLMPMSSLTVVASSVLGRSFQRRSFHTWRTADEHRDAQPAVDQRAVPVR